MAVIDEDRFSARVMDWSNGRVALIVLASLGLGFALGALLF